MSCVFDGAISKLEYASVVGNGELQDPLINILFWAYANSIGEGSGVLFGIAFGIGISTARPRLFYTSANTMRMTQGHSILNGQWDFTLNTGRWNAVAVTYDRSNNANDPLVRVNFAPVSTSETSTPNGTFDVNNTFIWGNVTAQTGTWDGFLAYGQVHTGVILTPWECDQALRYPGSITRGLLLPVSMKNPQDMVSRRQFRIPMTGTALAIGPEPPMVRPRVVRDRWRDIGRGPATAGYLLVAN